MTAARRTMALRHTYLLVILLKVGDELVQLHKNFFLKLEPIRPYSHLGAPYSCARLIHEHEGPRKVYGSQSPSGS